MKINLFLVIVISLIGCSRAGSRAGESLGRLRVVEVRIRDGSTKQDRVFVYRFECDKRTVVLWHLAGYDTPDRVEVRLRDIFQQVSQNSRSSKTQPLIRLDASDHANSNGTIYGGQVSLTLYSNAGDAFAAVGRHPAGQVAGAGLFQRYQPGNEFLDTDQPVVTLQLDAEVRWRFNIEKAHEGGRHGP